jgi:RNA polymerase sigma factor (sigma-70 family)
MTAVNSLTEAIDRLATTPADEDAWRLVFREMWPFVFAVVYRRIKSRAAAEDVAQDVLMSVFRTRPFGRIREEGALRAYVWKTALNAVASNFRKAGRKEKGERHLLSWLMAHKADVVEQVPEEHEQLLLEEALQLVMEELAPDDRKFLELLAQGRTLGEAAAALGLSYSNAGVRYYRLKRRLRKLLTDKEI